MVQFRPFRIVRGLAKALYRQRVRAPRAPDCRRYLAAATSAARSAARRESCPHGSRAQTAAGNAAPPSCAAVGASSSPPSPRNRSPTPFGPSPPE